MQEEHEAYQSTDLPQTTVEQISKAKIKKGRITERMAVLSFQSFPPHPSLNLCV